MENKNLKNNQVINESLFLRTQPQSEPKKITLQEFIKKHRSSKTYKEDITFNWVHLASTENTYWGVVKLISKWIKKSIKAIRRAYKKLVSFCRVSNYQNKKIIEILANSKHEQMYVFSIKAGFKQFLSEFQKLIRKAIKQLKSKPKAKPKQKASKIQYIPDSFVADSQKIGGTND